MLRLYNTLTRRKEPFAPVEPGRAGIYSCGPTVYRDVHIGNLRTYLMADWLRRLLAATLAVVGLVPVWANVSATAALIAPARLRPSVTCERIV